MSQTDKQPRVEEDVDDLDDILDKFSSATDAMASAPSAAPSTSKATSASSSTAPASGGSTSAAPAPAPAGDAFSADFAQEFAKQMESVMRELGVVEDAAPAGAGAKAPLTAEEQQREEAFRKAWETMLVEGMDGLEGLGEEYAPGKAEEKGTPATATRPDEDGFQRNIREAMERLKASETGLRADADAPASDEIERLLSQLGDADGDGQLEGILESMMGQLMSKDILYDPLKELHDNFPPYLEKNARTISAADKKRYEAQQACITKIIAIFEEASYSDEDTSKNAQIVALMSEMQTHGAPPAEIMGPLPPGLDLGADGMPLPPGCTIA